MNASTWTRILKDMATSQAVTIGMHRIKRLNSATWLVNGERLDLEFALYALVD